MTNKRLKQITVKVFQPGNKTKRITVFNAGKGKAFTGDGLEELLRKIGDAIEKEWPGEEYKLVPIGEAGFNFVHQGKAKEVAA